MGSVKEMDFPKAELHCHLDGCFRIETIIELARSHNIPLPSYDPEELCSKYCVRSRKRNLREYLLAFRYFSPAFAGNKESIARITREAIEDKAKQGVRYIEMRYSPQLLVSSDATSQAGKESLTPREIVEVICQASVQPQIDFNIEVRFILCCILSHPEWSMEVARLCEEFKPQGVVGIDIAGSGHQGKIKIKDHLPAYQYCKAHGIHTTVHAGEAGPAEEVQCAMDVLKVERIGHGYHVVKNEAIYAEAKEKNMHFEVCPISSYLTGSVDSDLTRHPAKRFMKDKVNFSLNTDDPGLQHTCLHEDYNFAQIVFGFSTEEIKTLNLNALRAAFCEEDLKQRLIKEFQEKYKDAQLEPPPQRDTFFPVDDLKF